MTQTDATGAAPRLSKAEMAAYAKATIGFALLYAACVSFYYRSWLFGYPDTSDPLQGGVLNVAIGVGSVALAAYVGLRAPFKGLPCVLAGIALLAVGSALAYCALALGWGSQTYSVSLVCAGAGMSLALPCWYELFARYSPRWIAIAYGAVASAGMLCTLAAELFGSAVLLASNLSFLAASAALLALAQRDVPLLYRSGDSARTDKSKPRRKGGAWRDACDSYLVAAVSVFAISVVYGALSSTAAGSGAPRDVAAPMAQVGGLVVGVLFLAYFGLKRRKPSALLFNVVFGVVGAAVLLLPFLHVSYSSLLYAFASAAWKLMLLVLLYLVAVTPTRGRRELLVGLALACALPRIGLSVGTFVAGSLNVGIESDFMRMTAIAVIFLYLMLMVVWFINSFERKRAEERARAMGEILKRYSESQEDVRTLRIDAVAEKAELTKREREVLAMMARGRDLAYICDELCLSRNTVKGYQKSIYAKLGVHSKQELIDMADRA